MREILLDELRFSASVILSGEEVVPRFRVMTPEGDWTIFVPLPNGIHERMRRMRLVSGFMAWKSATTFVFSTETIAPDAVFATAIGRSEVLCVARPILRKPLSVGEITWLKREAVGDEIVTLLPRGCVELDTETEAALIRAFGPHGEFETKRMS